MADEADLTFVDENDFQKRGTWPRENKGTEREAQGVGRDMSCPRKLFLTQRKSRFSGGSLFSEMFACSLVSLSGS